MATETGSPAKKILSLDECAKAWAGFTIGIWKEKLKKYKVGEPSGKLRASFKYSLTGNEASNLVIKFEFLYYGKFVDMGVGKGTKISGVSENKTSRALQGKMLGNRRRPKKWYGKTLFAETATLREILARDYAHKGALVICENITDNSIK